MRYLRNSNVWLWAIVILGVAYIVLWISGVRMPLKVPNDDKVIVTGEGWEDPDEQEVDSDSEMSFDDEDFELPSEPEVIDDGRDPNAPLL